ncbi:MAG TPA: SDR family NAD(P)-dependent oxidoreductase [Steroidobacteraceae bacterium]|jgi:NAD(P)-dependent dehydrogenase (short-subunit alcohol dehydrogenase family)
MTITFRLLLGLLVAAPLVGHTQTEPINGPKAVLVTGASTGIGRKITERLAADGYFVYAGARKDEDLKALGAIKNVQPIRLDVTKPDDIVTAVATVIKGGRGLYGLVNNAGIASRGSVADMKMEEFDLLMAVNVAGPVRVTRAFEPLIIAHQGRITTIGSIAGVLPNAGVPGNVPVTAYTMSKHAMEAFADSLADQLQPQGVLVSIVEPGNYDSDIAKNSVLRTGGDPKRASRSMFKPPDEVAAAVEQALFEPKPKRRYLVAPTQNEAELTIRKQIEQLVQLNEGQSYTFDRAALIKMLDEALVGSRPKTH